LLLRTGAPAEIMVERAILHHQHDHVIDRTDREAHVDAERRGRGLAAPRPAGERADGRARGERRLDEEVAAIQRRHRVLPIPSPANPSASNANVPGSGTGALITRVESRRWWPSVPASRSPMTGWAPAVIPPGIPCCP